MNCRIKMLAMDVDGTMTDGHLFISGSGELFKIFNVNDGMGIKNAQDNGIKIAIITSKSSDIVDYRANELGVADCYQGVSDKLLCIEELCEKYDYLLEEIAYIGDDINDIPVLKRVGLSFAPANAVPEVKKICDVVLKKTGGQGAVRECIDLLLKQNVGRCDL